MCRYTQDRTADANPIRLEETHWGSKGEGLQGSGFCRLEIKANEDASVVSEVECLSGVAVFIKLVIGFGVDPFGVRAPHLNSIGSRAMPYGNSLH